MTSGTGQADSIAVEPFQVAFDGSRVAQLRERLRDTRWSAEADNEDGSYGTTGRQMRELIGNWADGFDWDGQERSLNAFSHFCADINGVKVHFIHVRGVGYQPMPLILTHGWPETFRDWHRVIGPLSDPASYGAIRLTRSMSSFRRCLASPTQDSPLDITGVTPPVIARLWHRLMRDGLGYSRFGAAGGDWGSFTSSELGTQFPQDVIGIYLSYPPRFHVDVENLPDSDYDEWEQTGCRGRRCTGRRTSATSHPSPTARRPWPGAKPASAWSTSPNGRCSPWRPLRGGGAARNFTSRICATCSGPCAPSRRARAQRAAGGGGPPAVASAVP